MTLPVWPSTVPSHARDGWQMSQMFVPPDATEMKGGNQRLRGQPGNNVATVNYPLTPLTLAEYATFDTFMRTTLGNGASRWTMNVTIAGAAVNKTVQLDQGKSPTATQEGAFMNVTLPLRIYGM